MPLIIQPTTIDENLRLLEEIFVNNQDKVTKISNNSATEAVFYGVSKIAQKAEKDIGIVDAKLSPFKAAGTLLDEIALTRGIPARFGVSKSSTFIRIFAESGTTYTAGVHTFSGNNGIVFELTDDITIGSLGFAYAQVRSVDEGSVTNVAPLTISTVSPIPEGHQSVLNEFTATGGRDIESDDLFRDRILKNPNLGATDTINNLVEVFRTVNNNILNVIKGGYSNEGKLILNIVTQNGINLTTTELDDLLQAASNTISITDIRQYGLNFSLDLRNIEYFPIDVDFRVRIASTASVDDVRRNIQIAFNRNVDFRFWTPDKRVEWEDLLLIARNTNGVEYIPDNFFNPRADITVPEIMLPRFRQFIIRDLDGNVIADTQGVLNPIYYPAT